MKILYIGSICNESEFEATNSRSRTKVSFAPQHFEAAILKGLSSVRDVELTCISAECIATYPHGSKFYLSERTDDLGNGLTSKIAPAINLPFIKPKMHANAIGRMVEKWLRENQSTIDKCVFLYGFYTAVAEKTFEICKKYGCKCFTMITDMPSVALTEHKGLKGYFKAKARDHAVKVQGLADGYVFITKQMADVVAPGKPFHVMEVLVDTSIVNNTECGNKRKALMYAGTLYKKYGIDTLIDVYEQLDTDYELWIMGAGDYEEEIKKKSESNPMIKFFGVVSREEVMRREQEASLLLNIRNPKDEYTKYSFPSKMIEYILSGTPVFTTKLPGFPADYDEHLYYNEEYTQEGLIRDLKKVLSLPEEELKEKGKRASEFVRNNKNCERQMAMMVEFIKSQL